MCNSIIGKKKISINVKTKIYKSVYLPTLLYGPETRVMLVKLKSGGTSSEISSLRKIGRKEEKIECKIQLLENV